MRINKMYGIVVLIVFGATLFAGNPATAPGKRRAPGVYFYTGANFTGWEFHITSDCSQMPREHITAKGVRASFENRVSSIRLVGVFSIAIYSEPGFRGNCDTITKDMRYLNRTNVGNNAISSVRVNAQCSRAEPSVTLYDNQNFQGRSIVIKGDTPDLGVANFRNRTASFKLYKLNAIAVFNRTHYQGECQTFRQSCPSLAGTQIGRNSIASIKINSECAEHLKLVVRNRSAMLIQVWFPSGYRPYKLGILGITTGRDAGEKGKKEIVSGAAQTYYMEPNQQISFIVKAMIPSGELLFPEWVEVCKQEFFMGRSVLVTVKGSYFTGMKCERTLLN